MRTLNQEGKAKEGTSGRDTTCDPKALEDFPGFGCPGKGCVPLLLTFTQPGWCQRLVRIINT